MRFASREDAGKRLGACLKDRKVVGGVVLGLPRGGVLVAREVATAMRLPLDVLVVRKIGHPRFREYAVGALGENGVIVLDPEALRSYPVPPGELDGVIDEEMRRLAAYEAKFHHGTALDPGGKSVVIVDDGLATGSTMEAAVQSARSRQAARVIAAAPVASSSAVQRLAKAADAVIVLHVDPGFEAVGQYYSNFQQTTDAEVLAALDSARIAQPG